MFFKLFNFVRLNFLAKQLALASPESSTTSPETTTETTTATPETTTTVPETPIATTTPETLTATSEKNSPETQPPSPSSSSLSSSFLSPEDSQLLQTFVPNFYTYTIAINAFGNYGDVDETLKLLEEMKMVHFFLPKKKRKKRCKISTWKQKVIGV